MKASFLFTKVS